MNVDNICLPGVSIRRIITSKPPFLSGGLSIGQDTRYLSLFQMTSSGVANGMIGLCEVIPQVSGICAARLRKDPSHRPHRREAGCSGCNRLFVLQTEPLDSKKAAA